LAAEPEPLQIAPAFLLFQQQFLSSVEGACSCVPACPHRDLCARRLSNARERHRRHAQHGEEPPFDRRAREGRLICRRGASLRGRVQREQNWKTGEALTGNGQRGICCSRIKHAPPAVRRIPVAGSLFAPGAVVRFCCVADVIVAKCIVAAIVRWKHGVAIRGRLAAGTKQPPVDGRCTQSVAANTGPGTAA